MCNMICTINIPSKPIRWQLKLYRSALTHWRTSSRRISSDSASSPILPADPRPGISSSTLYSLRWQSLYWRMERCTVHIYGSSVELENLRWQFFLNEKSTCRPVIFEVVIFWKISKHSFFRCILSNFLQLTHSSKIQVDSDFHSC